MNVGELFFISEVLEFGEHERLSVKPQRSRESILLDCMKKLNENEKEQERERKRADVP